MVNQNMFLKQLITLFHHIFCISIGALGFFLFTLLVQPWLVTSTQQLTTTIALLLAGLIAARIATIHHILIGALTGLFASIHIMVIWNFLAMITSLVLSISTGNQTQIQFYETLNYFIAAIRAGLYGAIIGSLGGYFASWIQHKQPPHHDKST